MAARGIRKSLTERIAEKEKAQKRKKTTEKLLIGAAAVTTASAMVAAIYAACKAMEKDKAHADAEVQEEE